MKIDTLQANMPDKTPQNFYSTIQGLAKTVHKSGYPFIATGGALTLVLLLLEPVLGLLAAIVTGWVVYFFRDPVRVIPEDETLILSPADGRIEAVTQDAPPPELLDGEPESGPESSYVRVSVFLNIFDVHVNRLPTSGTVEKRAYRPGQFLNAAMDKASQKNERCGLCIRQGSDCHIYVVQIAGLVARRIVCDIDEGESAVAGRRFGIIRFGSRVDVYIPDSYQTRVAPGQRAIGGETVLASIDAATQNLQTRRE